MAQQDNQAVYICPRCSVHITGKRRIARHEATFKLPLNHPARCDRSHVDNTITAPIEFTDCVPENFTYAPVVETELLVPFEGRFTREQQKNEFLFTLSCIDQARASTLPTRNLTTVQNAWEVFKDAACERYSDEFWMFFLSMHKQPRTAIDAALHGAKSIFGKDQKEFWSRFPTSKKTLEAHISAQPSFMPLITHTQVIDLNPIGFDIRFTYRFLDPIWAWVRAAGRLPPDALHWVPVLQTRIATGERVYGGGVQHGTAFEEAFRSCPQGTFPMLFNLHWDGTGAHGLSATPIVVGVGNFNGQDVNAHFCITYMPHHSLKLTAEESTKVKFYTAQKCIRSILGVLETAALTGVECRLPTSGGSSKVLTLHPRLIAMTMDQPEQQLFFGQQNKTCCTRCRKRKGASSHRRCPQHDGHVISTLYNIFEDDAASNVTRTLAGEKLTRHGFNPKRRCVLPQVCEHLLIRTSVKFEIFPCLGYRDRMHAAIIFLHRTQMEVFQSMCLTTRTKLTLDARLLYVSSQCGFRCGHTNRSIRVQKTLFSEANMSASDRICVLFLLPHVLGHTACVLPTDLRDPVLQAVAYIQQVLIAMSNHRAYTKEELDVIFNKGCVYV